ncbi:MAG: glycoside hydrolase family 2 protein, partial [Oscillospiraceae bacterium]|nr:glycoside hydrolase family 2 protein [Oscillospiraceae bacterium]
MRTIHKLNQNNWTFTYHDGSKQKVTIPHTWNNLDGQDGGDDYFRGTCTYETTFLAPSFGVRERVYLQFDGVNSTAKVVLNDVEVMTHDGGYSTFRKDVTSLIQTN